MNTQIINFSIPKSLLTKIDRVAKQTDRTRSELIREALRTQLDREREREQLFSLMEQTARKNRLTERQSIALVEEAKQWARRTSR